MTRVIAATALFRDVVEADRVLGFQRVTERAVDAGYFTKREAAEWLAHFVTVAAHAGNPSRASAGLRQSGRMATTFQVTFDSADPAAHAAFWAEALHYVQPAPPEGFDSWDAALDAWGVTEEHRNDNSALVDPEGVGPRIFFQKVPEPKTAKNRVHLDLRAAVGLESQARSDALEAECARLVALGARRQRRLEADGINEVCIVMEDPEGNEFCLD